MPVTFQRTHHFTATLVVVFFFGVMGGFLFQRAQSILGPTSGPGDVGTPSADKGSLATTIGSSSDSSAQTSLFGQLANLKDRIDAIAPGGGGGSSLAAAGSYFDVGGKPYYCTKFDLSTGGYKSNITPINFGFDCNGGDGVSTFNADGTLPINAGPSWCVQGGICQDKRLGQTGGDPNYCNRPQNNVGVITYTSLTNGSLCAATPLYCKNGACSETVCNIDGDGDTFIAQACAGGDDCDDFDVLTNPEGTWHFTSKDYDCSTMIDSRPTTTDTNTTTYANNGGEYCFSGGGGNLATGTACSSLSCPYPTGYNPEDGYWTLDYVETASSTSRSNPCSGIPGCTNPNGYCPSSDSFIYLRVDCSCSWKHNGTEYK